MKSDVSRQIDCHRVVSGEVYSKFAEENCE